VQIKLEDEVQKNGEIVITEPVLPWRLELLSLRQTKSIRSTHKR